MAYAPASRPAPTYREPSSDSGALIKIVSLFLGIAVGVLIFVAVWMGASAQNARDDARTAAAHAGGSSVAAMPGMSASAGAATASGDLRSYAGAAPANADQVAAAHAPYPAALPAAPAGPVANVHLVLKDVTVQIAPGIKYAAWAWAGGAPGPVIHVRQGQTVHVTLTNEGAIPHSIDFHAARVAPNVAFADVAPGKSFSFSFKASDAGVFMYHCGTKPVLMHIANGMYGAIVVDPATPLPRADKQYVLVASEWYLSSPGLAKPAQFDMAKAHARMPDWMTFNGYAGQYVKHPLTANPGDTVRFWIVDAGPSIDTDFHVVGTLLNRAWVDADLTHALRNVQTVTVPAGGGGVFDLKIDKPGLYPFVSHAFASVDMGQVGLLNVGNVQGTMSH
ncbi:MAG: nitrite reductase [Candidatus Rokuibacteriota bacterium]|nr:MAG: nitrite reductase [Candidatus Rokubacteria bacterium]